MSVQELVLMAFVWGGTPAGGGWAASRIFDQLRHRYPVPTSAPASHLKRLFYRALYAPLYAWLSINALAALIGAGCAAAAALFTGADPLHAAGLVLSAFVAPAFAALRHALYNRSPEMPVKARRLGLSPTRS